MHIRLRSERDASRQVTFMLNHRLAVAVLTTFLLFTTNSHAATYRIGVPPVMSQAESMKRYDMLLRYLNSKTGDKFELVTTANFMGYWQTMRRPDAYDFLMDGAHLAAYRVDRRKHRYVVRQEGVVSYSLVARGEDLIMEPEELLNRTIAILPAPNMSAIVLAKIYNNPSRQPKQVVMNNADEALDAVRNGKVDAAIVPTAFLPRYPGALVILSTDPMPGLTMTASPNVPQDVVVKVREALLQVDKDASGKTALVQLQFGKFITVTPRDYEGLGQLLYGLWGY